jgi:hypothetical protein
MALSKKGRWRRSRALACGLVEIPRIVLLSVGPAILLERAASSS